MASACAWTWWTPITDAPAPGQTQLRIGRLTKAHGLKGAIKVELYTDDPDRRFVPGSVFTLQVPTSSAWHGKTLELRELRWYNSHAVAFFKDVPDRSVAESLVKAILWVNQDLAELPEEDDAWYDHQLVGLAVERDGARVGSISRVDHLPAQDLLAVATDDGEVLVPFVKAIVTKVDIAGGVITVDPPAGLFEELPEDDEPEVDVSSTEQSEVAEAEVDAAPAEEVVPAPASAHAAGADIAGAEAAGAEAAGAGTRDADAAGTDIAAAGAGIAGAGTRDADAAGTDIAGTDIAAADAASVEGGAASDYRTVAGEQETTD